MKNLTKAIMTMIVVLVLLNLPSCATVDTMGAASDIGRSVDATRVVCETADVLSKKGIEIPGVEQCDKIVDQLESDEMVVVFAVLNCASKYDIREKEFTVCAVDAGWEPVRDRIIEMVR